MKSCKNMPVETTKENILHILMSLGKRGTCQYCKEQGIQSRGNRGIICSGCKTEGGQLVFLHKPQELLCARPQIGNLINQSTCSR